MEKAQRDSGTPGGNSVTGEDEQAIKEPGKEMGKAWRQPD